MDTPKCPICGNNMEQRSGKYGDFYGCKSYPECKGVIKINSKIPPKQQPEPVYNPIEDAMKKKGEMINDAQDRKEKSIKEISSISNATAIVANMIHAGLILDESQIKPKMMEYVKYMYSINRDENSGVWIDETILG